MAAYTLPDLRYDYGALEPHVSGRIMALHHAKHHAGYVKGANDTLQQLDVARYKGDFTRLTAMERALAFHLSGHILHSLFWQNLCPNGDELPHGPLAAAIFETAQKLNITLAGASA
jgi:Fe-Mn family superoxide dismutase